MATDQAGRPAAGHEHLPPVGFVLLFAITLFWGANWPAMKLALTEIPVWSFRTICLIGGGGGLLAIARLGGIRLGVPRRELGPLLLCALFNVVGWHLFTGYGLTMVPAGRAAILAFTMPLWATLLSALILGEALTLRKILGLALGLAGIAVLIGPDLRVLSAAPLGSLLMLCAAISWAAGVVGIKYFAWSLPNTTLTAWQLLAGAVPISIGALVLDDFAAVGEASPTALLALAYTVALPMLFCQWAYVKLVRLFPAALAAMGTMAIPVVGVLLSAAILNEPVGFQELASLVLVCAALAIVLVLPALKRPDPGQATGPGT